MDHSIDTLVTASHHFARKLHEIKACHTSLGFTWYGYDILGNLPQLGKLLTGKYRDLFVRIKGRPILDIGAADGDLAFFLETCGFDIDIVDWPATNWNELQGAYHLKQLLSSRVNIHQVDLNEYFSLPRERYGLVLFLGILYHLQNPYYVLNKLSQVTEFCVLSTRIAQITTDRKVRLADASVAYLLGTDECNNDASNYWIFSLAGLKKLIMRTHWEILACTTIGQIIDSNPSSPEYDERVFLLLRSCRER